MTDRNERATLTRRLHEIGFTQLRLSLIRHTHASLMLTLYDWKELQERMGTQIYYFNYDGHIR